MTEPRNFTFLAGDERDMSNAFAKMAVAIAHEIATTANPPLAPEIIFDDLATALLRAGIVVRRAACASHADADDVAGSFKTVLGDLVDEVFAEFARIDARERRP